MKQLYIYLLIFFFAGCISSKNVQKLPTKHYFRYGVSSGHVVYSISGIKKGSEELFFDQFGARQSKLTKSIISIGTEFKEVETNTIYLNDSVYMLNLEQKNGRRIKDNYLFLIADSLQTKNLSEANLFVMKREQGLEWKENAIFLGKECKVYQVPDSSLQMWFWKGIPLKIESNFLGIKNTVEAVRIQTELSVPESKFTIPEDIVF